MPQVWTVVNYVIAMNKISDRFRVTYPSVKEYTVQDDIYFCKMLCKAVNYNVNFNSKQ